MQSLLRSSIAFKLFLHCLTRELEVGFFFLRRHAAGRRRAARGRRLLLRSVLRLIANMTFKLFLHCLVCDLEVEFFCVYFFLWCRRRGTAAQDHGGRNQRQPAANQVISHVTSQNRVISQLCDIT
jgi:hypothetical protein